MTRMDPGYRGGRSPAPADPRIHIPPGFYDPQDTWAAYPGLQHPAATLAQLRRVRARLARWLAILYALASAAVIFVVAFVATGHLNGNYTTVLVVITALIADLAYAAKCRRALAAARHAEAALTEASQAC